MPEDSRTEERIRMVRDQIEARGVGDRRVLDAMREIPRHLFIPPDFRAAAYHDRPLPIGSGQTISQPYIVGLMTSLLELKQDDKVLEIGAGSGYQAAILSKLARIGGNRRTAAGNRIESRRDDASSWNFQCNGGSGRRYSGLCPGCPV